MKASHKKCRILDKNNAASTKKPPDLPINIPRQIADDKESR
jgi:hypothetical protein